MTNSLSIPEEDSISAALQALEPTKRQRVVRKVILAALGSIPWVGGILTAIQSYQDESGQVRTNQMQREWLEEHRRKMQLLSADLAEVVNRLQDLGDESDTRIESEEYLSLV